MLGLKLNRDGEDGDYNGVEAEDEQGGPGPHLVSAAQHCRQQQQSCQVQGRTQLVAGENTLS